MNMLSKTLIVLLALVDSITLARAQTFNNYESYCEAMSEMASPTLLSRTLGEPKQKSVNLMQGMTDPVSIRMIEELIEFAYSRPQGMKIDAMRAELRKLCLERKIFAQ